MPKKIIEDRRVFQRYRRKIEFELKLDRGKYNCKTIDYSAEGICLHFMDGNPSLQPGDIIEIKIEDPKIELLGEVVWIKETKPGLIIGFKRTDSIKGSLPDFRLTDILIGLQRSTKTGILGVITGQKLTKIFIKNGDMIFANTNQKDDRLGEVLLRAGKITIEQYYKSSDILKRTGDRLGKILVELGYLRPKGLFQAVRHQVESIILSLFSAEYATFEFIEGPLPTEETITLRLSAANLIYRGVKRINSFHHIVEYFPPLDTALCLTQDTLNLFQDLFFVLLLDKRASTTSLLAQITSNRSIEVGQTDHRSADV